MTTAAGTTLSISASAPATDDPSGYAAITFVEIGQVEKIGAVGGGHKKVDFQPFRGPAQKYKGGVDYGAIQPIMAFDPEDAGQVLMAAADEDNENLFSFCVTYPDGSKRYFRGRVFGCPENVDGADTILTVAPTIEICTRIVKSGAIFTPPPPPPSGAVYVLSGAPALSEGNSGTTNFSFTVTRSNNLTVSSTADWAVTGTGSNPANAADFVGGVFPSGQVSFAIGETTKSITVAVQGDVNVETNETFTVTISNVVPAGTITTATAIGTIINDDVTPPPPPASPKADSTTIKADSTAYSADQTT